jgi:hypothetical protein
MNRRNVMRRMMTAGMLTLVVSAANAQIAELRRYYTTSNVFSSNFIPVSIGIRF